MDAGGCSYLVATEIEKLSNTIPASIAVQVASVHASVLRRPPVELLLDHQFSSLASVGIRRWPAGAGKKIIREGGSHCFAQTKDCCTEKTSRRAEEAYERPTRAFT